MSASSRDMPPGSLPVSMLSRPPPPSMAELRVTEAELIALFLQSILYGINLVTLAHCLRRLLFNSTGQELKPRESINWLMLIVALIIACFATLNIALELRHCIDAFVYFEGTASDGVQFGSAHWVSVMQSVDPVFAGFIVDAILIYRCWIVWGRRWLIVTPSILLWLGLLGCGTTTIVIRSIEESKRALDHDTAFPLFAAAAAFTLAVNILTTGLMVYKIWTVDRETAIGRRGTDRISPLQRAMRITIDSALLYTTVILIYTLTYVAQTHVSWIIGDSIVQIIGINFNLIIKRVDSGKAPGSPHQSQVSAFHAASRHSRRISGISTYGPSRQHSQTLFSGPDFGYVKPTYNYHDV